MENLIELKNITKIFPGVRSLDNVHFTVQRGEVHALMGENGAGKSTLMKIICGVHKPEEGTIFCKGDEVEWSGPSDARNNGISVIHQELKLSPNLTVAENVLMGANLPKNKLGLVNWNELNSKAKELLDSIGSDLAPEQLVSELSIAQQQIVEIARALSIDADLIIMDEPSATLSGKEIEKLFELIKLLKSKGVGIVYISHRMEEIFEVSGRLTVLRDGQYVATKNTEETTEKEIIQFMVGREMEDQEKPTNRSVDRENQKPVLEVSGLQDGKKLINGTLDLYRGEIIGLSGLVGSGRSELLQAIFGHTKAKEGVVKLEGDVIENKTPREAIHKGIALVPESRKDQSLFLELGVGENISILNMKLNSTFSFLHQQSMKELEEQYKEKLNVKTPGLSAKILNLSGGNQQKAIIARWLSISPKVLLLDEPTRGVDVGAKAEIYDIIFGLADQGYSIIVVSSELPEIIFLSDRVFVMNEGSVVKELSNEEIDQETIMTYATGGVLT